MLLLLFLTSYFLFSQCNSVAEPRVADFRKAIFEVVENKVGDTLTKMGIYCLKVVCLSELEFHCLYLCSGAIFASGIIDAGGRNATIALLSPVGQKKMAVLLLCCLTCIVFMNKNK